ncbi:MAG: M23 family metallopeptidase [Roseburia sp.]|nr:M23 family metallopeptidase [Roseburia sp.]
MRWRKYFLAVLLFLALVTADCLVYDYLTEQRGGISKEDLDIIRQDMVYFPVPESSFDPSGYQVSFVDSYGSARNFGGDRVHEGCDLMPSVDKRGHYPVVSISDGVVEKIGWLKLGGYRIGVRSPHGVYFYYAHLNDYVRDFAVGDTIKAGEVLGFMGDSGYGEEEGTTGMFPVHLHLGIYLNNQDGREESQNPYPFLLDLEKEKLKFYFE